MRDEGIRGEGATVGQAAIVRDLGRQPYEAVWRAMQGFTDLRDDDSPDEIWLVEHDPVFTLGQAGKPEHVLMPGDIPVIKVDRGGQVTYHGPGQLVGYPILDLDEHFTDIHRYLRTLEEVIIATLADYGLSGDRSPGETGVWLDVGTPFARKICAMGVRASRWVTMHGWAFNLNTDLRYFEYIIPCGIKDKAVTSLQRELGRPIDEVEAMARVAGHFARLFEVDLVVTPADRLLGA